MVVTIWAVTRRSMAVILALVLILPSTLILAVLLVVAAGATLVHVGIAAPICDPERDRYGVVTAVECVLAVTSP